MHINPSNLVQAQNYINRQFTMHSWWPKEQPEQAKHEFSLMLHDPAALTVWCDKWLDAGQCRQLEKSIS